MSFPYKAEPMSNQVAAMKRAWGKREFALFHEMGTGKTFTSINLAAGRYLKDQINAVLVICPTPIKLVWEDEIAKWCPCPFEQWTLQSGKSEQDACRRWMEAPTDGKLRFLVIGVEALSQGKAFDVAMKFVNRFQVMCVADESSKLKNFKSLRTKNAIKLAHKSLFRLILTGTPITQGVHDLYAQFYFLNPKIIGLRTFTQFKAFYCVVKRFDKFDKIVGYINVDKLLRLVSPYVDIVKKEDVLDLPNKVYEIIRVDPSPNQLKLIKDLKDMMMASHKGEELYTETILERLTRFQQIIGGHFPFDIDGVEHGITPIEGPNPKLAALLEVLEDLPADAKVIIWARFNSEIALLKRELEAEWGKGSTALFYGKDNYKGGEDERKQNVHRFINDPKCRFMVSNPAVGGMGQTWVVANTVIYYSNSFSYEDRKQSEDRAHRKGQTNKVTYIDIEANHEYDKMILNAITRKQSVAEYVDKQIVARQEHDPRNDT